MRSATSFFDKTTARSDLRRHWPIAFIYTCVWLVGLPVNLWVLEHVDARGDDARPSRSADHHRQLSHARRGAVRVRLRAGDGAHGLSDEPARRGAAARAPGPARDAGSRRTRSSAG